MMASSYFDGRADHRCRSTSERKRRKNDEGAETPTPVGLGLLGLVIDLMYNKMYSQGLEKIMIRTRPVQ